MGTRRIRGFNSAMLLLFFTLGATFVLVIHLFESDNLVLYIIMIIVYGFTLISNISMLHNTDDKIILSQLMMGFSMLVLALSCFVPCLFIVLGNKFTAIFFCILGFFLFLAILRWVLIKIHYYNFNSQASPQKTFLFCIIGVLIGRFIYQMTKFNCGESVQTLIMVLSGLTLSILFGFIGVFGINRYILARSPEFQGHITYLN